jgi:hypothetical protein
MPVVTIRGQLGSGAPEVGWLVADMLHTDYVDRAIIQKVAELLNRGEHDVVAKEMPPGSLMGRIAETFEHYYPAVNTGPGSSYLGVYLPVQDMPLGDSHYLEGLTAIIKELAENHSIVIRGRGSQFILKDYPDTLHVMMVAPLELRVKRVMENRKLNEDDAKKEISRYDSSRREFIKRYFQAEIENPVNYDLILNTNHLSFESAASIIVSTTTLKGKDWGKTK